MKPVVTSPELSVSARDAAFRVLVECLQDYSIYMVNVCGQIISWNLSAERLYGYTVADVMGQSFSMLFPPDVLLPAEESGDFDRESVRRRKDGRVFLAQEFVAPLPDEHGEVQGFARITRDISPRLRLEERFRQVVQEAPNAMILVNAEGRILLFNRQAELTFGYLQHEMVGHPMERLVPQRFRGAHPGLRQGFLLQPEARPMGAGRDLFGLHKDGSEFPVEIGLNPLETEEGTLVLAAIVDITARKMAQQQIEAALKEKTVLLNEIHHRVKNNLQVIISLLNMQANHLDNESVKNILIDSQARVRSMALIHQLLYEGHDFSRVDLGDYVQRFGQLLLGSFGPLTQRIKLNVETPAEPVYIELQRATPCGLLINELVANAFRHAYPKKSGVVRIKLEKRDAQHAVLIVEDHGVGLSEPTLPVNAKTLGFQLVPSLADQIGGTLTLKDNQPGTRFELCFPVMEQGRPR